MSRISLQFKLLAAFILLLFLIVAPATFAVFGMRQSYFNDLRLSAARDVLSGHLRLAERGQRLLRHVRSPSALPGDAEELRFRADVAQEVKAIRASIARELEYLAPGSGGSLSEAEELNRLEEIRARLDRAAAGERDVGFRSLLSLAIQEEEREVRLLDAQEAQLLNRLQWLLGSASLAATLFGAAALYLLLRQLRTRMDSLTAGTRALAAGDLGHRIALDGSDEFAHLGNDIDRLAAELQHQAAEIASSQDRLASTVAERTGELASANRRLEELNERRRRFLEDISHELRTPLTIIRGESEVTVRSQTQDPGAQREALSRIAQQAVGMARLVDDLLFVARAEANEPKLVCRPTSIGAVIYAAATSVRGLVEADGGSVTVSGDGGAVKVNGDADRLSQLVYILLDNAIRYSSDAPRIDISIVSAPGGVRFDVKDRGIGIPASEIAHVFDRYRRGAGAHNSHSGGSGLGLPLAQAIVLAHGGEIGIESPGCDGTTVSVFLPGSGGLRAVA